MFTGRDALYGAFQFVQLVVVRVGVGGGALGLVLESARYGLVEGLEGFGVGGVVLEGEPVPEGPEDLLLLLGDDTISLAGGDALGEALLDGPENAGVVVVGVGCDAPEGPAQSGLAEGGGASGLGGELDHLVPALGVQITALDVLLTQESHVLVAVPACAHGELSPNGIP